MRRRTSESIKACVRRKLWVCRAPNAGSHCSRAVTAPFPFLICVTLPRGVVMVSKAMFRPRIRQCCIRRLPRRLSRMRRTQSCQGTFSASAELVTAADTRLGVIMSPYIHGDGVLGKDASLQAYRWQSLRPYRAERLFSSTSLRPETACRSRCPAVQLRPTPRNRVQSAFFSSVHG